MYDKQGFNHFRELSFSEYIENSRERVLHVFLYANIFFLIFLNIIILLRYSIPLDRFSRSHYFLLGILGFYILLLIIKKRFGKTRFISHSIFLINNLLIAGTVVIADPVTAENLIRLLYLIAVFPFLLLGYRSGLIWGIAGGLTYAILDGLRLLNLIPFNLIDGDQYREINPLIMLTLYFLLFVTGLIYERMNAHQARQILLERNRFVSESSRDKLTGLANRNLLDMYIPWAVKQADRDGEKLGAVFIDLDDFKPVNDKYGHRVGDLLLQNFAVRIRETIRDNDIAIRLGGDEFLILFRHLHQADSIDKISGLMLDKLNQELEIDGRIFKIKASAGIVLYPDHISDPQQLLDTADKCMYEAKKRKSGIYIYGS